MLDQEFNFPEPNREGRGKGVSPCRVLRRYSSSEFSSRSTPSGCTGCSVQQSSSPFMKILGIKQGVQSNTTITTLLPSLTKLKNTLGCSVTVRHFPSPFQKELINIYYGQRYIGNHRVYRLIYTLGNYKCIVHMYRLIVDMVNDSTPLLSGRTAAGRCLPVPCLLIVFWLG